MIAPSLYGDARRHDIGDEALARLPESAFGDTDWARMALRACTGHLEAAIRAGQPYRIASAVRAVSHAPTLHQVDAVAGAVCDALLAEAYAARNSRLVAGIAEARAVVDTVVAGLRSESNQRAADTGALRERVDGYIAVVALQNAKFAERLDATGAFAARIALAMKLEPATVLDVELAGRLADIGMLGVPAESHVAASAAFTSDIAALSHLAPIVRSHHERYDGLGYPDGLAGNEIPLEARIVAIAAAFIDLIGEGSLGKPLLAHEACAEIALNAGAEFDPAIVTATLRLLRYRQRTSKTA
jgi:response regulator RpfG family c-di-GMP phosphodiesterase